MNICLIGLGKIGALLPDEGNIPRTHLSYILKNKKLKILGLVEKNLKIIKKVKKKFKNIKLPIFKSFAAIKKLGSIDLLVICTQPQDRLKILQDIKKNKIPFPKFILFEKPFANNFDSGLKILSFIKKNKIKACVNYIREWDESFINFIKLIKNQEVIGAHVLYSKGFLNSASHYLFTLIKKFGKINFSSVKLFGNNKYKIFKNYSFKIQVGSVEIIFQGLKYKIKNNDYLDMTIFCKKSFFEVKSSGVLKRAYKSKVGIFYKNNTTMNANEFYKETSIVNGYERLYKNISQTIKSQNRFNYSNLDISLEINKLDLYLKNDYFKF